VVPQIHHPLPPLQIQQKRKTDLSTLCDSNSLRLLITKILFCRRTFPVFNPLLWLFLHTVIFAENYEFERNKSNQTSVFVKLKPLCIINNEKRKKIRNGRQLYFHACLRVNMRMQKSLHRIILSLIFKILKFSSNRLSLAFKMF
jgi:hypothetical protein